jgi:dTDP-4-dehydrorhamnose 3,5-epimerase-like enzyme
MTWNPDSPPAESRFLDGKVIGITPVVIGDSRGRLMELVRRSESPADIRQVYAVWIGPTETRADHYHLHKSEWLIILGGMCRLDMVDMDTGATDSVSLEVGNGQPMVIGIPPRVLHTLTNESDYIDTLIVACASTEFDPSDPDMFKFEQWGKEGHTDG